MAAKPQNEDRMNEPKRASSSADPSSVRGRLQAPNLSLELLDLLLLLFDGVEHGPQDRVAVDQQVAFVIFWSRPRE